jgi:choline dehydrogenase-like flavoprotein
MNCACSWVELTAVFRLVVATVHTQMLLPETLRLHEASLLFALFFDPLLRARYGLRYLSLAEFKTLTALAEVLVIGEEERLTPEEIGHNVDRYLATFRAHRKWVVKVALLALYFYPLLKARATFTGMAPEERLDFVKQRFVTDVAERRIIGFWRTLVQAMIRVAQQMVYLGYYGDKRTFASVGYAPFSERPRFAAAVGAVERDRPAVAVLTPAELEGGTVEADIVVVGSGAAGAVLAYRLAEAGRQVLILERGEHVDPSDFSEDETEMFSKLYADGALQLSRDFRFQVLQGMCVGGTTVVNNGVCFDLPDRVLRAWNAPNGLDAGLDEARLRESFRAVRGLLSVREQSDTPMQSGAGKFVEGIKRLGLDASPNRFGIVEANLAGCLGSGYCNIGCAYGKKLSMLDTVLPWAQRQFGSDGLSIISECKAERVVARGGRAEAVVCRLSDGRRLRVNARTIVVAAGALHSSWLLLRSQLGGPLVGRHLSFNVASQITADFEEELRAYDGLQISHYLESPAERGFVIETWFSPVVSQALSMPGWFEEHYRNMRRYAYMTSAGILVGTGRHARVHVSLTGDLDIDFKPTREELRKLIDGMKLAGRIYLVAGARRVMPTTLRYHEFTSESELECLDQYVRDNSDISLATGHPQGGNALSRDPRKGVVDPSFCVQGFDNLFVCDASVFPSSVGVNPQLTVMALADYAAPVIAQEGG